MRFAVDTGGTFTDLVVQADGGGLSIFKAPTTPDDPLRGVMDALGKAAQAHSRGLAELLDGGELIFATTRAINAILTGTVACTAFLTTRGHEDILVLREGGRTEPFDFTRAYPEPYVPRRLTRGVNERIDSSGAVVTALDEGEARRLVAELPPEVEAIAVCLLWSIANPDHELRLAELIAEERPGVAYTLSHRLNPVLGEYHRASSTSIDASLKPLMSEHLSRLESELRSAGLTGSVLVATSGGGLMPASEVAAAPIHSLNSGPSMGPLAGRHHAAGARTTIVADTGGTSYDLSVVQDGVIGRTSDSWIGPEFLGHPTGFPSIDVRSIGAGGGSIAWVDGAGLLQVGPRSAGSVPGPACYGRGGTDPTVTDASVVLGYLDPDRFLDGTMRLDEDAAADAVRSGVGEPLGIAVTDAAVAIVALATEHMVQAIDSVTVHQGIDPHGAVLVAGGGAAGLNSVAVARRLGCTRVVFPDTGATFSATGALVARLARDVVRTMRMSTDRFEADAANVLLEELEAEAARFLRDHGVTDPVIERWAEARYPSQSWDLELPLPQPRFRSSEDVARMVEDFHVLHEQVFAIRDERSPLQVTSWRVRASDPVAREMGSLVSGLGQEAASERTVTLQDGERRTVPVVQLSALDAGKDLNGPAIVEAPSASIVVDAGTIARRTETGALEVEVGNEQRPGAAPQQREELMNER